MNIFIRIFLFFALTSIASLFTIRYVSAQSFPDRPVRLVVPYPPGGTVDILARALSEGLTPLLKQPVIVDNRPGAGGTLAAAYVAKSPGDGYTLFVSDVGPLAIARSGYKNLPYDTLRDFAPVTMISFPELKVYQTEVFVRLPEQYRMKGRQSEWGNANRAGAMLECFLESPAFDRTGSLYVVDVPFGRIFRVSPAGVFDLVCEYDGWPYGLKIHKDGRIFIADYRLGIVLLDPASGKVTPLVSRYLPVSLKGVNGLCFSKAGDLYFTDAEGTILTTRLPVPGHTLYSHQL